MLKTYSKNKLVDQERSRRFILLSFILVLGGLFYLRYSGVIASPEEIVSYLDDWYSRYGYWVIFISALIEGIFVVNLYFPGSTAILLGVALATQNELSGIILVMLTIIGFFLSYCANYFLGKYGLFQLLLRFGYGDILEDIKQSISEKGPRIMLTTFFHPNIAAAIATGAGVINMPFKQFAIWCFLSLILWDIIWGILVYVLGEYILKLFGSWMIIPFTILWTALIFIVLNTGSIKRSFKNA